MHKYGVVPAIAGILAVGGCHAFGQDTRATQGASPRAHTVVVPAHVEWANTLLRVGRGQLLRFESSGEIRLSFDAQDVATAGGARSGRKTGNAPVPSLAAGALIGRVNNGPSFPIGDSTQPLSMPASGTLYLMVNDDHVADNSGNLVVGILRVSP